VRFTLRDGNVYYTYSAFSRGLDALLGMYKGWTERRWDGTSMVCGCAATMSTMSKQKASESLGRTFQRWAQNNPSHVWRMLDCADFIGKL